MDITGYQAATDEMVLKEKRAWQVPLDHMVLREKQDRVSKDTDHRNWTQCVCSKGEKGVAGSPGPRSVKGESGPSGKDTDHRNWKQCVLRSGDGRDIGPIKVR